VLQGTTTTCDNIRYLTSTIDTGEWPSEDSAAEQVPKRCRHLTGWTDCLLGDSCDVLIGGAEPRQGDRCAAVLSTGMLMIFRSTSGRTNRLSRVMIAASVLTGVAEPRGMWMQSGTHNLSKCQLTGWNDCREIATSVVTWVAEPLEEGIVRSR
jgi:hypothetical protein